MKLVGFVFRFSFFVFYIRSEAEYRILTFKILFRHSQWGRISYFDIRKPIRIEAEYRVYVFRFSLFAFCFSPFIFRLSNWGGISYINIQNPISTFALWPNTVFWHSKTYSNWGRISYFDNWNLILTFELRPNIVFWHSKPYFYIRIESEYRILTFEVLFDIRTEAENRILTFEILFKHSNLCQLRYLA